MVRTGVIFFILILVVLVYLCVVYHYTDSFARMINKYFKKFSKKDKKN
jgi:hypothetical protein